MSHSSSVFDLHSATHTDRVHRFSQCCSSAQFATQLASASTKIHNFPDLIHRAREIWFNLNPSTDWEEAFRGHPRIGDDPVKLKEKFSTRTSSFTTRTRTCPGGRMFWAGGSITNPERVRSMRGAGRRTSASRCRPRCGGIRSRITTCS